MDGFYVSSRRLAIWSLLPGLWLGICALCGSPRFPLPVLAITVLFPLGFSAVYFQGKKSARENRRFWMLLSIISNLLFLGIFKYFNFFIDGFRDLCTWLHVPGPGAFVAHIALPVGISFYTFQSISYSVDAFYRKHVPTRDLPLFAAYLAFFPQLVAGPIERAHHLLPQFESPRKFSPELASDGVRLILVGFFKKLFVANSCAVVAGYVFDPKAVINGPMAILGAVAFAFQIYGDFSGYTDIARGSAQLLGFTLVKNFAYPYCSITPSDFWRRWHISLSTWFRDYVYIPLGGNRTGVVRTCINLLLTMGLAGLWHGASWMFIAWGLFHGAALVAYHLIVGNGCLEDKGWGLRLVSWGITQIIILVGWAIFASASWDVFSHWGHTLTYWPAGAWKQVKNPMIYILIHTIPLLLLQIPGRKNWEEADLNALPWWGRGLVYAGLFICVATSAVHDVEFIYFQF